MKSSLRILGIPGLVFLFCHCLYAEPPATVVEKLRAPTPGVEPLVLFLDSAEANQGSGDTRWVATSGTRLVTNGRDPWGNDFGAFGPPEDAAMGAAIAASIESPLLSGDSGTLIFCVQVPEVTGDPAMIISRGAWGDSIAFDLRADRTKTLRLYAGGNEPKPDSLQIGQYVPGTWLFIGLTWKKDGAELALDTFVGEFGSGQFPMMNSFRIRQAGGNDSPVLIAGRTNRDLNPALLTGGLYCALAIYDVSFPQELIESIFETMDSATVP